MRKKILHLLYSNKYSGAENVVITIISNMSDEYECYYVSPPGPIQKILEKENVSYIPLKSFNLIELWRVIQQTGANIVHAHDFRSSIIASLLPKKITVISHLHNNPPWIKKINILSIAYLFSSLKYKKILVVSKAVISEYIFTSFIQKKIVMISNPVDIQRIKQKSGVERELEKYHIAFIGRLVEQKNPQKFIEIINGLVHEENMKNIRAVMIGDGELKFDCETLIKKYALESNICMLGFVENPYPVLKESQILCITSNWEGYGLVAIEALSLAKPVVSTPVGGLIDIVDNKCGLLCNNKEDFIKEIKELISNKDLYIRKQVECKRKIQDLMNFEKYIHSIEQLY